MKVYAAFDNPALPLGEVAAYAQRVESIGFAGLLVPEAVHDGFLTAMLALEHTESLTVATSVALAFPRSPTTTAYAAWDLQAMSAGRFQLGLGSQVKGNITRRFGMQWSPPVARMRDYIGALRAIWRCWQYNEALDYCSDAYRIDRMQPFFNPGPIQHPNIPIVLGGVNAGMTELAGEAADTFVTHPTNTVPRYLREVVTPRLETGASRRSAVAAVGTHATSASTAVPGIIATTFVATGPTDDDVERERRRLREHLGFLYSTPQYARTLELLGRAEVGQRLHALSREGAWDAMPAVIDDELFSELVPTGTYASIVETLTAWYGGVAQAITLGVPKNPAEDDQLAAVIEDLQS